MLTLPVDRARALCMESYARLGLSEEAAATCTDCALFASVRGLDSHGIVSVLPGTCNNLARGMILAEPHIEVIREAAATAVLRGGGAAGPVIGALAMKMAIEKAAQFGIGAVAAYNCHHFGAASYYSTRALAHKMVGFSTVDCSPVVAPFGGRERAVGTNPISYAVPGNRQPSIVMDIATSAAAHGQVYKAARRNQPIPLGWAIDAEGRPTTDANAALKGLLLPFGGHKGYSIGLFVDLITGALTGYDVGRSINQRDITPESGGQSLLMLAINIAHFTDYDTYTARVDQLADEIHRIPPAEGFKEVLLPGDMELRQEAIRSQSGIPLYQEDWDALMAGLGRAGLPADELSARYHPDQA